MTVKGVLVLAGVVNGGLIGGLALALAGYGYLTGPVTVALVSLLP